MRLHIVILFLGQRVHPHSLCFSDPHILLMSLSLIYFLLAPLFIVLPPVPPDPTSPALPLKQISHSPLSLYTPSHLVALHPSSLFGCRGFPSSLPSNRKPLKYPSLRTPSPSQRLIHTGMALFPPQPPHNIKIQNGQLNPSPISDLIVMVLPAVPESPTPINPRPL